MKDHELRSLIDDALGNGVIAFRRERIATAMMVALLGTPGDEAHAPYVQQPARLVARDAIKLADALIAELDKPVADRRRDS